MTLRDALAAALGPAFLDAPESDTWEDIYPFIAVTNTFTGRVADAVLSDPAFRAALVESVAEALRGYRYERTGGPVHDEPAVRKGEGKFAAAIVARMLGEEP